MKPLNDGTMRYYSINNGGSSSAKTMDKKELFIIKTAHKGEVEFNVMSLEEPNKANANVLKNALENSIMKFIVCTPLLSAGEVGLSLQPNFQKEGGRLERTSTVREGC